MCFLRRPGDVGPWGRFASQKPRAQFELGLGRARAFGETNMMRIGMYGLGLFVFAIQGVGQLHAADPKGTGTENAAEMGRALPFVGTVSAVNASGHSFTLNGKAKERVFKVTDKTEILSDGKAVPLSAMTVGAKVQGSAIKHETDWEAKKVTIGAKEPSEASKK